LAMLRSPFKSDQQLSLYDLFVRISKGEYPPLPETVSAAADTNKTCLLIIIAESTSATPLTVGRCRRLVCIELNKKYNTQFEDMR